MQNMKRATLDELFVGRDDQGKVRPIEVMSPLLGRTLLVLPMTYGMIKETDKLSSPVMDWPLARKTEILQKCMIDPSFATVSAEAINEFMDPLTVDHLISMIMLKSSPFGRLQRVPTTPMEQLASLVGAQVLKERLVSERTKPSTTGSTSKGTRTRDKRKSTR